MFTTDRVVRITDRVTVNTGQRCAYNRLSNLELTERTTDSIVPTTDRNVIKTDRVMYEPTELKLNFIVSL